jgi:hypothetical protein
MALLDEFMAGVLKHITEKNAEELKRWLIVEPVNGSLPQAFQTLCQELQTSYQDRDTLDEKVELMLPIPDQYEEENPNVGAVWPGFQTFIKDYLEYWRDVDFAHLLDTYDLLSTLTKYVASNNFPEWKITLYEQFLYHCPFTRYVRNNCPPSYPSAIRRFDEISNSGR